jgi:S1-C subfamily serine protease
MATVSDLVATVAQKIAGTLEPMDFVSLPSRPPTDREESSRGYGAYLGSIPDFGDNSEGVRLAGVTDGSPAALAGLREGDIIVGFAGSKVQNLEDLVSLLRAKKPGDEVEIVVLRTGVALTLRTTLRARG